MTGLCGLVWCITTLVSCHNNNSSMRKDRLTISVVEEVEKYVKVLDEVLS